MLTLCYNIAQLALFTLFWPILLTISMAKGKYRRRLLARLGFGLRKHLSPDTSKRPTFWIHGLSVGEITSAVPLVIGIRNSYPKGRIIITTATETGENIANTLLGDIADHILSAPFDALPVVTTFINTLQPDVYLLIETDFWPNTLATLHRRNIPTILVNGRISQKSFALYRNFSFFFLPMFGYFNHLCMQTDADREKMVNLGIDSTKVLTLGNLKYDTPIQATRIQTEIEQLLPNDRLVVIAGSTHTGEERIILHAYHKLRRFYPNLYLVIAPRSPARADEIIELGNEVQLVGTKRTETPSSPADFLLLDTIGELVELYRHGHIAIIGGSLIARGGHNPIEPAIMSLPVIFGPHMDDFQEIASGLLAAGGAKKAADKEQLLSILKDLISNDSLRQQMGLSAKNYVTSQQGVVNRHLQLISAIIDRT